MTDNPETPFSRALNAATFAKNALINVSGFSPTQLVFGRQPQLPSVMLNRSLAQECLSSVKIYTDRMNAIFAARKIFSEIENSTRLNRALKAKTIPRMEYYETGDEVYYRRTNDNIWQGPAKVIGFDGKTIIIKHGRFIHSTSQPHLIKAPPGLNNTAEESRSENNKLEKNLSNNDMESSDEETEDHLDPQMRDSDPSEANPEDPNNDNEDHCNSPSQLENHRHIRQKLTVTCPIRQKLTVTCPIRQKLTVTCPIRQKLTVTCLIRQKLTITKTRLIRKMNQYLTNQIQIP